MIPPRIRQYLDLNRVAYRVIPHRSQPTAQRTAASAHVSGKRFAKVVVLRADGGYLFAMVPADEMVDLDRLTTTVGTRVELATEDEIARLFPDCEPGAMPPLGHLYGLPVFADTCLAVRDRIALNGGTHTDVIELGWSDFAALEHPRLVGHATW